MKAILTFLLATVLVAFSQAPPIQRNTFTTNLEPAAMDVVYSTTGDRSINLDLPEWRFRLNQGSNLTMAAFGDSTGLYTVSYLREPIFNRLGSNGFAAGQMANIHLAGAHTNLGAAASTNWPGAFYILGTNSGSGLSNGPGEIVVTNWGTANGGGVWSSVFEAAVESSPSAGTLMWQTRTNGGAWVNRYIFNANGAYGIITNRLVLPLGWYNSRLIYSNSGPTKVLMLQQFDGTLTGRGARFYDMTYAGSRIEQLTNIATNVLGPALALMNPSVLWLEHRDSSNEYVNALRPLKSLIDTWIPRADVVIVGVGPKLTDDSDLVGQNYVAREFCRTNRWTYLDMRAIRGYTNYFGVTNYYGAADDSGTHYPDAAWRAQSGSALHRLPILHNEAANGAYNAGAPYLSPPEGSRHFDGAKATNFLSGNLGLNGILSMQNYLDVNNIIATRGASASVVLQDRLNSTDNARNWTLFNSDYTLQFYQNAYLFEMSGKFGIYRFSPYTTGSPYSKLGDSDHYWNHAYFNGIQSTNSTNANLFINMGNVGIGTASPNSTLNAVATLSITNPLARFSGTNGTNGLIVKSNGKVFIPAAGYGIADNDILTLGTDQSNWGVTIGVDSATSIAAQLVVSRSDVTEILRASDQRLDGPATFRIGGNSGGYGPTLNAIATNRLSVFTSRHSYVTSGRAPVFLEVNGHVIPTNGVTFPTNVHSAVTLATNGASGIINAGGALTIQVSNSGDASTSNKVFMTKSGLGIGVTPMAHIHTQSSNNSNAVFRADGVAGATPAAPSTVVAWIPVTLNGTNGFIPFYQ